MNMTMLFYVLVLCFISWSVDARRNDYVGYIQPYTYTNWGSWGEIDWCVEGTYANAFRLKVEQGTGDDTALNGIQLLCSREYQNSLFTGSYWRMSHNIMSNRGRWGSWTSIKTCAGHYLLHGVRARSEPKQGSGDDTAANNYNFICQNTKNHGRTELLQGDGMSWGSWTTRKDCPSGSFICGIKTQVEPPQGSRDDTALNGAIFYCCRYSS